MKFKDYIPLRFLARKEQWEEIARVCDGTIAYDIRHKQNYNDTELLFFQTNMEKIMYELWKLGRSDLKEPIQRQIDEYFKSGEWK